MDNITSTILSIAEKHLGEFRIRNGQVIAKYCPFCHGGNNHDIDSFAIGTHNGAWNCMRGTCEGMYGDGTKREGDFRELCNFFGIDTKNYNNTPKPLGKQKKVYVKPNEDLLKPLTEEIITYFGIRKISEETLKDFHISSDEHGNIVFPFYRDNILTYLKFRKPKKHTKEDGPKEWTMQNMEPILFGMDMAAFNKPLVITEGMIDALSLYEAGITNVVSVPMGCNNLDWINLCWDWLEKFQQIILFGDSDEPGQEMISTLMKRLGEDRCMVPQEYPELIVDGKNINRPCKDANEILYAYGPEILKSIVDSCEPAPIKGVLNLASVPFIDPLATPRIYTKIPDLDNAIAGLGEGGVTVFTGKRGEGKSTLNGSLLLSAIDQGYNVCAYSGELSAYKFKEWIMLQATESHFIGVEVDPRSGKEFCVVSKEIQQRIEKWIDGKFFLFDNAYIDDMTQQEAILKVFEMCARRYGCKLFLVDNLMIALTSADEENKAQAKFAAALKAFAVKYKVHVILIAHPRKRQPGQAFTNDDVSGSSAITNLADIVISVERPSLRITKNREFGQLDYIRCNYDPANRRIYQANTGDRIIYGWDHTGIKAPEDPACNHHAFDIQEGVDPGMMRLPC